MADYIKLVKSLEELIAFKASNDFVTPNVTAIFGDTIVDYNLKVSNYLKFTAEEDNSTISLNAKTSPDIKYSLNGGDWTPWDYSAITLNIGDTLRMKGNNSNGFSTSNSSYNQFQMTGKIGASGNIMSLLYDNNFEGKLIIPRDCCFADMFGGCAALTTAPELPATTLVGGCYTSMFYGCTSLTNAPELPATTLANGCYRYMFYGCTSLTNAPTILPATTLADNCYSNMFYNSRTLTNAPELPATTLTDSCYSSMFYGCTSLTNAPELLATTLAINCYYNMFSGCTSLTNAPELPSTTLDLGCYNSMFYGCTSLTNAPELPSTTLIMDCYNSMFYGCTELNYIKMLATDISDTRCLNNWVNGVSSTGTFVKHPNMTSLPTGVSGIPTGWTVQDVA